jgi:hypothetical protein
MCLIQKTPQRPIPGTRSQTKCWIPRPFMTPFTPGVSRKSTSSWPKRKPAGAKRPRRRLKLAPKSHNSAPKSHPFDR